MSKKLNSRNTKNPYELISGVRLASKENKNIYVEISATKFSYVSNKKGKKHLVMLDFDVNSRYEMEYSEEHAIIKLFKHIERFSKSCRNPLEVITMFKDAYKQNKDMLFIKFIPCPAYADALDSKFIYESLMKK